MLQVTTPTSLGVDSPQGRKLFIFDRVFPEDVNQRGIWEYLHDSVNSFVQGYNVSLLAYGQSGAGKSYTMGTSGPAEQNDPLAMGECTIARPSLDFWLASFQARVTPANTNGTSQVLFHARQRTFSKASIVGVRVTHAKIRA